MDILIAAQLQIAILCNGATSSSRLNVACRDKLWSCVHAKAESQRKLATDQIRQHPGRINPPSVTTFREEDNYPVECAAKAGNLGIHSH